jgi:hypothetical protein
MIMMRLIAACSLSFLLLVQAAHALAEEGARTMVRAHLEPAGRIVVGQPVQLVVEVLVTTWFTRAPEFPVLDIPGALVTVPDEPSTHLTEQINGITWFGLTRTYIVTPMEPREFTIPRLQVVLHPGLAPNPVKVWSPARRFTAQVPAGAEGVAVFLATGHLEMIQRFDHKLAGLRVGDAFTRTITLTAKGTQAMFLPPISFTQVDGLSVYPNAPHVDNLSKERTGFVAGRRMDSATYVIQQPGHYQLPAVTVQWWDLRLGKLREYTQPPVAFDAAPNPNTQPEIAVPMETHETKPPPLQGKELRQWAGWAGGILVSLLGIWLFRLKIRRYVIERAARRSERRRRDEASEAAAFDKLREAVDHGDDVESVRWLYQWLDRFEPSGRPALAAQAAGIARDDQYKEQIQALLDRRFGYRSTSTANLSGKELGLSLRRVRKQLIAETGIAAHDRADLTPLNPE